METELRRPEVPEKLRFEACDVSKEKIRACYGLSAAGVGR
jgi:hypothetical protein